MKPSEDQSANMFEVSDPDGENADPDGENADPDAENADPDAENADPDAENADKPAEPDTAEIVTPMPRKSERLKVKVANGGEKIKNLPKKKK